MAKTKYRLKRTSLQFRIDCAYGCLSEFTRNRQPLAQRKRRTNGYGRQKAREILKDIGAESFPVKRIGRLSREESWLIYSIQYYKIDNKLSTGRYRFLVAMAEGLKLHPYPKWLRVYLKIEGANKYGNVEK